jgi:hypothetical protein
VTQINFGERASAARKVGAHLDEVVKYAAVAGFPERTA